MLQIARTSLLTVILMLVAGGCSEYPLDDQPSSDSQAMRSFTLPAGFGGQGLTGMLWDDLPTALELGVEDVCGQPLGSCSEPVLWDNLPNILERGIIELKGSNLEYLRAQQHIEFAAQILEVECSNLVGPERDLSNDPALWEELPNIAEMGIDLSGVDGSGTYRPMPILDWSRFEPTMTEGVEWLVTQPPQ